jgi:hypothetical protein
LAFATKAGQLMDAKDSLKSAIERFREMTVELRRFMADSEKVFLTTGASLQHLESEATRILTAASNRAGMEGGDRDPAQSLHTGLGELDQHLESGKTDTDKGVNALTKVLSGIATLAHLDGELQTIVATLHALASTTHLENSRGNAEASFDSVVSDLRTMARAIKPKFGEVLGQARKLRTIAESALGRAHLFLDRHRRELSGFREDARTQLAAVSEACLRSRALADRSTESMQSVRDNIGTVLQSLQVQDLARQMLEHVVEDLEDFASNAEQVINCDAPAGELRAWLAELAVVTRVEAAQLGNACERLVRGLSRIGDSLGNIVSVLAAAAQEGARLSGKQTGTSVFAQLRRDVRATADSLLAHDLQGESLRKALSAVSETATHVQDLVEEVAELGEDARFIGLNAMVKAVRVGHAGATLTVLAREVQSVSERIQAFTATATSIMTTVAAEAGELTSSAGEKGLTGAAEVSAKLETFMTDLGAYQAALDAAVEVLLGGAKALRDEVDGNQRVLQGLGKQAKGLRAVSQELTSLHGVALADSRGASPPPGRMHREARHYTMEEERQVQRLALGDAIKGQTEKIGQPADVQSAEGSVEFF